MYQIQLPIQIGTYSNMSNKKTSIYRKIHKMNKCRPYINDINLCQDVPFMFSRIYEGHCLRPSGWWFQPLWKIWKSNGIIVPSWMEKNIYIMFQTTTHTKSSLKYVFLFEKAGCNNCFRECGHLRPQGIQGDLVLFIYLLYFAFAIHMSG